MKYPAYNSERIDTGIRTLERSHVYGKKSRERIGGECYVYLDRITRRLDAVDVHGDYGCRRAEEDSILYSGSENECKAFIDAYKLPDGSEFLCRTTAGIRYIDCAAEREYFETAAKLSDDGAGLVQALNTAYQYPDINSVEASRAATRWNREYERSHPHDLGALTLEAAMKRLDITQVQLVRLSGVPASAISKLLNGGTRMENVSAKTIQALSDALGCLPKNLLAGEELSSVREPSE